MAHWSLGWLRERGLESGRIVDWGCGDGAAAQVFARHGWRVTGIDRSAAMLALARKRAPAADTRITWRKADLRRSYESAAPPGELATAFYDTLNYLRSYEDLAAGWHTLARSVVQGGYVIADVNTPYEYETAWNNRNTIPVDTDDLLVINRLHFDQRTRLGRGRIMWFVREAGSEEWRHGTETHMQRAHTNAELVTAIEQAGLTLIERRTPQGLEPTATATRIIYLAQKQT